MGKGSGAAGYESMELWDDGRAYFDVGPGGGPAYGSASLPDTNWHFLTLVFDGSQSGNDGHLKGYIDVMPQTLIAQEIKQLYNAGR